MDNDKSVDLDGLLRTAQIIIFGLVSGVTLFFVIVLFIGSGFQPFDPQAYVSMVMGLMALTMIMVRMFIPGLMTTAQVQKIAQGTYTASDPKNRVTLPDTDEGKLLHVFMTKTIIAGAVLEGAAFGNLIAFMLEGQIYSFVLAVLSTIGILMGFPTRTGLSEWFETQNRRLQEFKSMN